MILEWLEYLKTQGNQTAKDWGYLYQNVSLKFRSRRCAKSWQSHINAAHQLIREHLEKLQPKTVMIIGSGLLLEIPIQDLMNKVEKIYLVDLVHAKEIRKLAAKNKKIELIERDISSLLDVLKQGLGSFQLKTLPWNKLPAWDLPPVDWVISANLMSQIPLMISERLPMSPEAYVKFAKSVRDQHIERLLEQAPQVLLFADFETHYIDREGQRIKTEDYQVNLKSLKYDREWLWEISPFGETSRDYKIEMLVKAYWKF
ncbi:MAG TPA: hypothetical protein VIG33_17055 [Pseudobdellovibrionaceae bacterium]|jgi:hypothetical protein